MALKRLSLVGSVVSCGEADVAASTACFRLDGRSSSCKWSVAGGGIAGTSFGGPARCTRVECTPTTISERKEKKVKRRGEEKDSEEDGEEKAALWFVLASLRHQKLHRLFSFSSS